MKNVFALTAILFISVFAFAKPSYETEMQEALKKINIAHPIWQTAATDFEKIVANHPTKWLPLYYHALANTNASHDVALKEKDNYLDAAQVSLDKAIVLQPNESELVVLQANIYMMRIMVEPMSRGMAYSSKAFGALNKAKLLDAENPRIYVLWGLMVYNMPENFGGGVLAANAYFSTARDKFVAFEPASDLHPSWGRDINDKMLASYE